MNDRSALTDAERRATWRGDLEHINERLVDLRQQRHRFQELARLAENIPEFKGYFILDIPRWYAAFAAMAIRRETDRDKDVRSLTLVLDEIARFRSAAITFLREPIDLTALRADRRKLNLLSSKVKYIADKEIAHATREGVADTARPTFPELFECIDAFESIALRYRALLSGITVMTRDDGTTIDVRLAGASNPLP